MQIFDLLTKSLIVYSSNSKLAARRGTLVVALAFCPKILGRWWGPMNGILSVCECSLSIQDFHRWWANSKPNCCNLMFLQPQVVEMLKHLPHTCLGPRVRAITSHLVKPSLPNIYLLLVFFF